jgi:hypothetical protein
VSSNARLSYVPHLAVANAVKERSEKETEIYENVGKGGERSWTRPREKEREREKERKLI